MFDSNCKIVLKDDSKTLYFVKLKGTIKSGFVKLTPVFSLNINIGCSFKQNSLILTKIYSVLLSFYSNEKLTIITV